MISCVSIFFGLFFCLVKLPVANEIIEGVKILFEEGSLRGSDDYVSELIRALLELNIDLSLVKIDSTHNKLFTMPEYLQKLEILEIQLYEDEIEGNEMYNLGLSKHKQLQVLFANSERTPTDNGFYGIFLKNVHDNKLHRNVYCNNLAYTGKFTFPYDETKPKVIFNRPFQHYSNFIRMHFFQNLSGYKIGHSMYRKIFERFLNKEDPINLAPVIIALKNLNYFTELIEGAIYRLILKWGLDIYPYYVNSKLESMIDETKYEHIFTSEHEKLALRYFHLINMSHGEITQVIPHGSYEYYGNMQQYTCQYCQRLFLSTEGKEAHEQMCANHQ